MFWSKHLKKLRDRLKKKEAKQEATKPNLTVVRNTPSPARKVASNEVDPYPYDPFLSTRRYDSEERERATASPFAGRGGTTDGGGASADWGDIGSGSRSSDSRSCDSSTRDDGARDYGRSESCTSGHSHSYGTSHHHTSTSSDYGSSSSSSSSDYGSSSSSSSDSGSSSSGGSDY
jgi:hypothetical protein